jgi:hypothetical protein
MLHEAQSSKSIVAQRSAKTREPEMTAQDMFVMTLSTWKYMQQTASGLVECCFQSAPISSTSDVHGALKISRLDLRTLVDIVLHLLGTYILSSPLNTQHHS